MEYSLVVTPVTVCISRTFVGLLLFLVWTSDLWYVNVKGGSPVRVKTISAWSPVDLIEHGSSGVMCNNRAYPHGCLAISFFRYLPVRRVEGK